jgi:hypothetical protein
MASGLKRPNCRPRVLPPSNHPPDPEHHVTCFTQRDLFINHPGGFDASLARRAIPISGSSITACPMMISQWCAAPHSYR